MPLTSTIGTAGRDYSTIQAWIASFPSTLTQQLIGECYNDSEFTVSSGVLVSFSGHVTSSGNSILLTTGPGQSFADNANAQTNALTYNQANGVGLRANVSYNDVVDISDQYVTLSKLQIKEGGAGNSCVRFGAANCTLSGCLIDHNGVSAGGGALYIYNQGASPAIINTLVIERTSGMTNGAVDSVENAKFVNCTFVAPSDLATKPTVAINSNYGSASFENCAFFGFAALSSGTTTLTCTTCATDLASPPSGVTGSLTYASQFQNTTNAASDYRLVSGSALINAATTDTIDIQAANDIVGTSRPQGSAWDIGCWEYKSAITPLALAAMAAGMGMGHPAAAFIFSAAARGAARSKAQPAPLFEGVVAMTGLALGTMTDGPSATAPLSAMGAARSSGRGILHTGAQLALLAIGRVMAAAGGAASHGAPLAGRGTAQSSARPRGSGTAALTGRSTGASQGSLSAGAHLTALVARAIARLTGGARLNAAAALSATSSAQGKLTPGAQFLAPLEARNTLTLTVIVPPKFEAPLAATARAGAFGRAGAAFRAELQARASTAGRISGKGSFIAGLQARGGLAATAANTMILATYIASAARALVIGTARAAMTILTPTPVPPPMIINPTLEIVSENDGPQKG